MFHGDKDTHTGDVLPCWKVVMILITFWRKESYKAGYRSGRSVSKTAYKSTLKDLAEEVKRLSKENTQLRAEKTALHNKLEKEMADMRTKHREEMESLEHRTEQRITRYKDRFSNKMALLQEIIQSASVLLSKFKGLEYWIKTNIQSSAQTQMVMSTTLQDRVTTIDEDYTEVMKKIKKAGFSHELEDGNREM